MAFPPGLPHIRSSRELRMPDAHSRNRPRRTPPRRAQAHEPSMPPLRFGGHGAVGLLGLHTNSNRVLSECPAPWLANRDARPSGRISTHTAPCQPSPPFINHEGMFSWIPGDRKVRARTENFPRMTVVGCHTFHPFCQRPSQNARRRGYHAAWMRSRPTRRGFGRTGPMGFFV